LIRKFFLEILFSKEQGSLSRLYFDHLEKGISLDEFLNDFPTVTKEQAIAVIEIASKILTSKNVEQIYETAA
jgi:hypothetical protein